MFFIPISRRCKNWRKYISDFWTSVAIFKNEGGSTQPEMIVFGSYIIKILSYISRVLKQVIKLASSPSQRCGDWTMNQHAS